MKRTKEQCERELFNAERNLSAAAQALHKAQVAYLKAKDALERNHDYIADDEEAPMNVAEVMDLLSEIKPRERDKYRLRFCLFNSEWPVASVVFDHKSRLAIVHVDLF